MHDAPFQLALKTWLSVGLFAVVVAGLPLPPSAQASTLSPARRQAIAAAMGSSSAAQYCSGSDLQSAIEKGMMSTLVAQDLDTSAIEQIDLNNKAIGIAFFENLFADAFASCPGRARALWRQILEM